MRFSNSPSLLPLGSPNLAITLDWFNAPVCLEWDLFPDGNNSYNLASTDVDGHTVPHGMISQSQRANLTQMTFLNAAFNQSVSSANSQFFATCSAGNETAMVTGIGFKNIINNELFILQLFSYHHRNGTQNPTSSWPFRGQCDDTFPSGGVYNCAFSTFGVEVFGQPRLTMGGTRYYTINILQTVKNEITAQRNLGNLADSNYSHYVPDVFYSGPYIYGKAKISVGVSSFSLKDNN